jgi:hypothetical protein
MAGGFWTPSIKTTDPSIPFLPIGGGREILGSLMDDTRRDWDAPYQDIVLYLTEAFADAALSVGNAATGYTFYVNNTPYTPTYRSGSGTATWTLRIAVAVKNGQKVELSYAPSAGATLAVSDSFELPIQSKIPISNSLTKRFRFTLKDKTNAVVASESVQISVHTYASGSTANAAWMQRVQYGSVMSSAAGLFDFLVTAESTPALPIEVGDTVYMVAYRPSATESMAWTETVT